MTKKHFIALADAVRRAERRMASEETDYPTNGRQAYREELAAFCKSMNPRFDKGRWLDYIDGVRGPNGGAVAKAKGGQG